MRALDTKLTYAVFADARELNKSTVRDWVTSTDALAAQGPMRVPANATYKQRAFKYASPVVEEWLLQQLRHGDATHTAILQSIEENEPSLAREESYKAQQNACAWLKNNAKNNRRLRENQSRHK